MSIIIANEAHLVKGWLLSRKEVPQPVMEAVDRIIANARLKHLDGLEPERRFVLAAGDRVETPAEETAREPEEIRHPAAVTKQAVTEAELLEKQLPGNSGQLPVQPGIDVGLPPKERKPRAPMSEERRAQLAEQLQRARAARGAHGAKSTPAPAADQEEPAEPATGADALGSYFQSRDSGRPRIDTPPKTLIEKHDEYAGKRDPGQDLSDDDWPQIRPRCQRGESFRAIASDYDVPPAVMKEFIDRKLIEDARRTDNRGGAE